MNSLIDNALLFIGWTMLILGGMARDWHGIACGTLIIVLVRIDDRAAK